MKTSGYIIFILLYWGTINNLSCQNNTPDDSYYFKAKDFKKSMMQDSALIYFKKASIEYEKSHKIEQFINSYNEIGIILTRQDKYEEAKTYLDKALSLGLASLDSNNLSVATSLRASYLLTCLPGKQAGAC
jgi:tetratricopeptide (TPR) repeat protein